MTVIVLDSPVESKREFPPAPAPTAKSRVSFEVSAGVRLNAVAEAGLRSESEGEEPARCVVVLPT